MNEITLDLPYPPPLLSPNSHKPWQAKARAVKAYRWDCFVAAAEQRNAVQYPLKAPVEAHIVFVYVKGVPMDVDNALAAFKAGLDGICDTRLIENDRDISAWHASVVRGDRKHVSLLLRGSP